LHWLIWLLDQLESHDQSQWRALSRYRSYGPDHRPRADTLARAFLSTVNFARAPNPAIRTI